MKINVVGWYGENNVGDESFRAVLSQKFHNHEVIFSSRVKPEADRIIFGGGGVIGGGYFNGLDPDREVFGLGVDIPLNGPNWDRMRQFNFKEIFCRSREYAQIGHDQGAPSRYCPDLAFALKVPDAIRLKNKAAKPRIGIILTRELENQVNLQTEIIKALKELQGSNELYFIPMFESQIKPEISDEVFHRIVAGSLEPNDPRVHMVPYSPDPLAVLSLISQMDTLISMRFHGIIFSTIAHVPFISIANKGKHSLFCEQERLKNFFLELPDLSYYKITDVLGAIRNTPTIPGRLRQIAESNKTYLMEVFRHVKDSWFDQKRVVAVEETDGPMLA
jgi:polysaccharide pyruvyl transferase WcaK-like protein